MATTSLAMDKGTLLKWALSLVVPLIVFWALPVDGTIVTTPMAMFLAITAWAVTVWATDIINDVAVGLALPVLYIIFCGVKQQVVYAPWLSEVPIIVIGGFALGKILQDTGLGKRIGLTCVRAMGGSFVGALWGLTLAVYIVAPLIPAVTGKAAIFCAIAISLCEALDFKEKSREASAVLLAACLAVMSTKICYLTGGADTVLGMGLVERVVESKTTWMEYAYHNFIPGTLYTIMSLVLVTLLLPSKVDRKTLQPVLEAKLRELGPITRDQKIASILMLLTLIMLATDKLHGVAAGLVLILITFAAFLPGINLLNSAKFGKINFAPLFFIMGCMTIGSAGGALNVTQWVAGSLLPYFHDQSVSSASTMAYIFGAAVNFLLTPLAAITTMTSPLAELGLKMGMDPRMLYYSFAYGLDNLIFPYEYAVPLYFFSTGFIVFKDFVKVMAIRLVLAGIFVSFVAIPYWKWVM
ncbi:MAG: sodium:sulfate symporter [Desulfovibrionales bacterium]|nr:sodium:sulfate symporter [Desulfovibrionales bacterium]